MVREGEREKHFDFDKMIMDMIMIIMDIMIDTDGYGYEFNEYHNPDMTDTSMYRHLGVLGV